MNSLIEFYNGLPFIMRVYWSIAVSTSIVFLVQMVLTFVGVGHGDADFDVDSLGDATGDTLDLGGVLSLFSVRNVVNFLLGVGWGGVCFGASISHPLVLMLISLCCGALFVGAFIFMWIRLRRIQTSGHFRIEACVGMTCSVYLRIPPARQGTGKVQLSYHGSVLEIDALTEGDMLKSGSRVRIAQVVDAHTLLVEPL